MTGERSERRHKDRVTSLHQWLTLVGVPVIAAAIIGLMTVAMQTRDDARDARLAVREIQKTLPKLGEDVAGHEARLRVIEAREQLRDLHPR